jgi:hypothetical protein
MTCQSTRIELYFIITTCSHECVGTPIIAHSAKQTKNGGGGERPPTQQINISPPRRLNHSFKLTESNLKKFPYMLIISILGVLPWVMQDVDLK